jgi:hypothetical protein
MIASVAQTASPRQNWHHACLRALPPRGWPHRLARSLSPCARAASMADGDHHDRVGGLGASSTLHAELTAANADVEAALRQETAQQRQRELDAVTAVIRVRVESTQSAMGLPLDSLKICA